VDVLTVGDRLRANVTPEGCGSVYRMGRHLEFNSARLSLGVAGFLFRRWRTYQVIHLNVPNPSGELAFLLCERLLALPRPRSVVTFHAEVVEAKPFAKPYNRLVTKRVLARADRIIVSSPDLARNTNLLRPFSQKIQVIPFGVPATGNRTGDSRPRAGQLRLLFVGRLSRYKGLDVLLQALRGAPGFLKVVGNGPLRGDLERAIGEGRLSGRVSLLGRVSHEELHRLYEEADILLLPSTDRAEAFGYVLIEAMSHSTALITTELGTGTSWVNVHGKTGIVVPPRDVKALRDAIIQLGTDASRLRSAQAASADRYQERFRLEVMLSSTVAMYEQLLRR
jgi:rhamnosyl/mannosyltransferase